MVIFISAYFLGKSNVTISYHQRGDGEQIYYISGKDSFITISVEKKKTKQLLYLNEP